MAVEDIKPENFVFFGDGDENVAYERAWFNVMRVHRKLLPEITKALKACGINDPIWFEILLEVERAGQAGQPMAALETKLSVPQYALSRHIARLEKDGFLRRVYIADGRRKQILFLTEKGSGTHEQIWNAYGEAIRAKLSPHLSTDEAYALSWLLMKLIP